MTKIKVTNTGNRVRERLGSRILPNQTVEIEVNSRGYLTFKAVRDFEVEVLDVEEKETAEVSSETTEEENASQDEELDAQDGELDYYELTIDEVLKAVDEGVYDVGEALALEIAGKNRVTLIDKLETLISEED